MKTTARLLALSVSIWIAPAVAGPQELALATGCLACHSAETKMIGPTWKDIAARYRGDAKAPSLMAERVRVGSKGVWGELPMPPMPPERMSDADLAAVIAWVLAH